MPTLLTMPTVLWMLNKKGSWGPLMPNKHGFDDDSEDALVEALEDKESVEDTCARML